MKGTCLSTFLIIVLLSTLSAKIAPGQSPATGVATVSLFETEDILHLTLKTDLRPLLQNRNEEEEEQPATISYKSGDGSLVDQGIKVRTRGVFRRMKNHCDFPPIRLNFSKKGGKGTLFEGQDKLKLVTHCQNYHKAYEQYVLLEYLIYRMYNELTDLSFKVQLVEMTYIDESGREKPITRYGFLIEDDENMAARNNGIILDQTGHQEDATDYNQFIRLALFQYMIGNTDWQVSSLHNIRLVRVEGLLLPFPVPYDFDFSGLVNTPYASPRRTLPIKEVRQRHYEGHCRTEEELAPHISLFKTKKEAIYALFQDLEPLSKRFRKSALGYLDEFYGIINKPKRVRKAFVRSCKKT